MDINKYGPFANIVTIAGCLISLFGILLYKMMGHSRNWSWLAQRDVRVASVTLAARIAAVILMAITYVTINLSNFGWFAASAAIFAILGMFFLYRFTLSSHQNIIAVPEVTADGTALRDRRGNEITRNIVVGLDSQIKLEIHKKIAEKQAADPTVTTRKFLSGAGPYDPEILWDRNLLAKIKTRLATSLTYVALCAVMTLFLAAFIIVVFNNQPTH